MSNQLDLLIIHPGAQHGIYGALGDELTAVEPPLWARLIAGYVRDAGFKVKIIDQEAERLSADQVGRRARSLGPRLVCIAAYGHQPSASTQQMVAAGEIARAIKNYPGPVPAIIMVGGHVSALPSQTMVEEQTDYACVGEGPVTIVELLKQQSMFFDRFAIPGLVWRDLARAIIANKAAPLIEDLGLLHGQAWDLLPMALYRAHNWQCFDDLSRRQPYASIYTSLGCPYRCSFCCINAPFASNRYRMRKPADVVNEIAMLRETYGITTFKIVDEMFVLNERHYTAIAEGLIDRGIATGLNIWAYSRIDTVEAGHLPLLRRAGFRWLALGIESGSAYVRDGAKKRMRSDDIEGVVRAIQAAGINVIGNYIFGLPDDDIASMRETLNLACDLNTEFANFYSAMAYPGSQLYTQAIATGATLPESWRGYSQHNDDCRPMDTKHLSGAEVLAFRDRAFRAYFSRREYLTMIEKKFGHAAREHIAMMMDYKLTRKLLEERPAA